MEKKDQRQLQLRNAITQSGLIQINGEPLTDFTVECMMHHMNRLQNEGQLWELLGWLKGKCADLKKNPKKAKAWNYVTRAMGEEVELLLGAEPERKPVASDAELRGMITNAAAGKGMR